MHFIYHFKEKPVSAVCTVVWRAGSRDRMEMIGPSCAAGCVVFTTFLSGAAASPPTNPTHDVQYKGSTA